MSLTIPGRLHLIARRGLVYCTLRLFGQRFHYCRPELPPWRHWSEP